MLTKFVTVAFLTISVVKSQPCPNSCSGHGHCLNPGLVCDCFAGWQGADCSWRTCPMDIAWTDFPTATDVAHNLAVCSNRGICSTVTGTCTCQLGFEGIACERVSCPNTCSGRGKCQTMHNYAVTKDPGTGPVYHYTNIWDANKIQGCNCDSDRWAMDCSLIYCPTGDDPMTGNGISTVANPTQYNEVQKITCKANGGSFTLTFKGKTTVRIPFNSKLADIQTIIEALPTIGPGNTKIVMYSTQVCLDAGTSWTVEFTQSFGHLPLIIADTSKLLFTGSTTAKPFININYQTFGTKENAPCSDRGICGDVSGVCACSINYDTSNGYNAPGQRGDCGYATATIQYCPGIISCSGHGECTGAPTYECRCIDGWMGADCSQRTCPRGVAWFTLPSNNDEAHLYENVECSNMGTCDRSLGSCQCAQGFTVGAACEMMNCPGATIPCNGHGQCVDMNTLATYTTNLGDLTGYTYGLVPNNPATWDAFKVYGCYCDDGYTGYDCSQLLCPFGDDPQTQNQVNEVQLISCTDSDMKGNVIFTFRQQGTVVLDVGSSLATVQEALSAVATIGIVSVETLYTGAIPTLCSPQGSLSLVTFLTVHGHLPLIGVQSNYIDAIAVSSNTKGTKEHIECSNRGLCDRTTGVCQCFPGYSSSDGQGRMGRVGDCGFMRPVVVST